MELIKESNYCCNSYWIIDGFGWFEENKKLSKLPNMSQVRLTVRSTKVDKSLDRRPCEFSGSIKQLQLKLSFDRPKLMKPSTGVNKVLDQRPSRSKELCRPKLQLGQSKCRSKFESADPEHPNQDPMAET